MLFRINIGFCLAVESGILPSAFHFVSIKLVAVFPLSAKMRLAGEKLCSRWRSTTARW